MAWRYREVQIADDESVDAAGTKTFDINVKDPITSLIVRHNILNGGATVPNQPPELAITHIEIVDGGRTYWTLCGPLSVGAAVYGLGHWPAHFYNERSDQGQNINVPLLFGRYLGDEQFAFDPRTLLNPQLKITWTSPALYDDDNTTLGVTARVMEGLPTPPQCLMWKEIDAWTCAASATHVVDLPVDYPYRALMMRAYDVANVPSNIFDAFKMDCDVGKFIVFDLNDDEFRDIIKQQYGPYSNRNFVQGEFATWRQSWLGETFQVAVNAEATDCVAQAWSAGWGYYSFATRNFDGTGDPARSAQAMPVGYFPHNCYLYPFGRPDSPDTWFPAAEYGEIKLKIDESYAGATGKVAVQQPRTLP